MSQLSFVLTRKIKVNRLKGLGVLIVAMFIAACQPAQTRKVDNRKLHDGVLGVKADVVSNNNICKKPVKVKNKRYGRLSQKNKRRFLQDYVTRIRQKIYGGWLKPDISAQEYCKVSIKQRIDGCVRQVSFKDCRHYKLRATVRRAVLKASPLPEAPHPALFTDEVILNFKIP